MLHKIVKYRSPHGHERTRTKIIRQETRRVLHTRSLLLGYVRLFCLEVTQVVPVRSL